MFLIILLSSGKGDHLYICYILNIYLKKENNFAVN